MTYLEALVLGLVQGITEFLPISSSAHLKLVKYFFGIEANEGQVFFDLMCHSGTLVALLWYLRKDIFNILSREPQKLKLYFTALLPLIPFYFLLKPLRDALSNIHFLGGALCITGILLFLGNRWRLRQQGNSPSYPDSLSIGVMQAAALIPGISRSASTISMARILGWDAKEAVRFSFLLAIPTVIGGNLLEAFKLTLTQAPLPSFTSSLIGFLSSLGLGVVAVRYALPLLERGILKPFAWYCLTLGILVSVYMIIYG